MQPDRHSGDDQKEGAEVRIVEEMQSALEMIGGSVGFAAVFFACLIILWYGKYERRTMSFSYLFWYALIMLIVTINPLTRYLTETYLPEMVRDAMYLWLLPMTPVTLLVCAEAVAGVEKRWQQVVLLIAVIVILILGGTSSFSDKGLNPAETYDLIPAQDKTVLDLAERYRKENGMETIMIWGENSVMDTARISHGSFYTLYGRDLWQGLQETQIPWNYESWQMQAYELMQEQDLSLDLIADVGITHHCDVLILSRVKVATEGGVIPREIREDYVLYEEQPREGYLLYVRRSDR